jgi:Zn-dependent membrane protease YugP
MHYLAIILVLFALLYGPQLWVQRVLRRYSRKDEENFPGTGGELARHLLDRYQLQNIKVETTEQGDHYDPENKTVRLTKDKFEGKTLTAITVAAHECGHALQHAVEQPSFMWRTRLAKLAYVAQSLGSFLLFIAPVLVLLSRAPSPGLVSAMGAFLVMGFGIVVQLVTLPVELDASFRKALPILKEGYITPGQYQGAERILRAAAWTYVAASLASLLNFWRWLMVLRR